MPAYFFTNHANISKAKESKFSQKFLSEKLIFVEKIRGGFAYGVFFRYKNQLRVKFQENLDSLADRYFMATFPGNVK